nr:F0F1 ATP synthase subunit delta [Streptomyces alkaliphilus]
MRAIGSASREALASARERLSVLAGSTSVNTTVLSDELASVTALLDREIGLRRALTDPSQPGEAKAGLVGRLLTGQVGGETVDLVSGMVRSRWSAPRDLVDALEELADTAELISAERDGTLDAVEDELFRFSRIVASSPDLRAALAAGEGSQDRREARALLIRRLLGGRTRPATERLVLRLVQHPRGRSLEGGLESLSRIAAERRNRSVAVVTSAVPLTDTQRRRLGEALGRLYGRAIQLNLDVDPTVLGGISVRVGDEVIQGTIAQRLDEVSRRMGD